MYNKVFWHFIKSFCDHITKIYYDLNYRFFILILSIVSLFSSGVAHTLDMSAETSVSGYTVLAVNNGKLKSQVNVGDRVLLMCGAACRTSGGSNVVQYEWTSQDDSTFTTANSREVTVTANKIGSYSYYCKVTNCGPPSVSYIQLTIAGKIVIKLRFYDE